MYPGWHGRHGRYYEETECLQGSVTPFCYGLFETELGDLLDSTDSPQYRIKALDDHPVDDGQSSDTDLDYEAPASSLKWQDAHPMLAEQETRRDIVFVLILEHVGGMLRVYRPIP